MNELGVNTDRKQGYAGPYLLDSGLSETKITIVSHSGFMQAYSDLIE